MHPIRGRNQLPDGLNLRIVAFSSDLVHNLLFQCRSSFAIRLVHDLPVGVDNFLPMNRFLNIKNGSHRPNRSHNGIHIENVNKIIHHSEITVRYDGAETLILSIVVESAELW